MPTTPQVATTLQVPEVPTTLYVPLVPVTPQVPVVPATRLDLNQENASPAPRNSLSDMNISQSDAIGRGTKLLQMFYQNPVDGSKTLFRPVLVTRDEEVRPGFHLLLTKVWGQGFLMLPSCSRATAQNFAEFAHNLEMCTPKLEV